MSESGDDTDGEQMQEPARAFPTAGTVEFSLNEDAGAAVSGGRRRKLEKHKKTKLKPGSFETMGLSAEVLRGIKRKGYRLPTPIQRKAMPTILQGQDLVGMARTGSGKTAAFVIPVLERLKTHSPRAGARTVILAPTRELALQTHRVVKELGKFTDLRTAVLVGGDSMEAQFAELAANPDIIVATPGRLAHHLEEVEGMSLRAVEVCVFDEADRLFEMGFADQIRRLTASMPESRQTLLFSATLPAELAEFARAGLRDPEFVRLDADTKLSPDLTLAFLTVREEDKPAALVWLLREVIPVGQPTIVFACTRHHVELLHALLEREGIPAACVYGAMDQAARRIHIGKFCAGKVNVLVVTDVAARGIDIPLLDNVINYDFAPKPKLFIHRCGRAARAGRIGSAYSLLVREELPYLLDLHLFLSRPLAPAPVKPLQQAAEDGATLAHDASLYGTFPQAGLDETAEHVRNMVGASQELQGLGGAAANAHRLYKRTRPQPSPESVRRAKALPREGIHPVAAAAVPRVAVAGLEAEAGLAEITASLKHYRPMHTVFEAEVAGARPAGATSAEATMWAKRAAHAPAAAGRPSKARRLNGVAGGIETPANSGRGFRNGPNEPGDADGEEGPAMGSGGGRAAGHEDEQRRAASSAAALGDGLTNEGRFRDSDFYISHVAPGNKYEEDGFAVQGSRRDIDSAVMDLLADDQEGMSKGKRTFHWDKRKKRYVQLQPGERVHAGKRVRTESGARAAVGKSRGAYQKWSKANRMKVAATGDLEAAGAAAGMSKQLAVRFKKGGRGWKNPAKAPAAEGSREGKAGLQRHRSELKSPDQVRKHRKQEARKKLVPKTGKGAARKRKR